MNRILFIFLCVFTISPLADAYGQMAPARRIPPAIEKKVTLNAPADRVWEYLSDPANYKEFSRAKEFIYEGRTPESKIELTDRKGIKRRQTIGMVVPSDRIISYMVSESDYSSDEVWVYRFDVLPGDNKNQCEVVMTVYFGFDKLPEDMKKGLTREFDDIAKGLKKKFR